MDKLKDGRSSTIKHMFGGNPSLSDLSDIERSLSVPSIRVGSLYDARNDSLVGILDGNIQSKKEKVNEKPSLLIYKGKDIRGENLLETLRIDDETRLTTILKITEPNGILSIVNYSSTIDDFTRLIYYLEPIEEESLIYDFRKSQHLPTSSTHLITKIRIGISFIIVLQLSPQSSSSIRETDRSLEYLFSKLDSVNDIEQIISNEEQFLKNILKTKIYSNTNDLCRLNNVCEVYRKIHIIRQDPYQYRAINFILSPINRFYPHSDLTKNVYIQIINEYTQYIETFILSLSSDLKVLKKDLKHLESLLLKGSLQQELNHAVQLFTEFEKSYSALLKEFKDLVIQIRSGEKPQETLLSFIDGGEQNILMQRIDDVTKYFNGLKAKNSLIFDLQEKDIDYINISNTDVNEDDDQETLEKKLTKNDRNIHIFCSNDQLKKADRHRWDELQTELIESRANKKGLCLIYADFSYSSYKLKELQIVYSKKGKKKNKMMDAPNEDSKKISPKTEPTINIVLFGESGVVKSTFINAFANYLLYENIDQARSDEPIVIIPVSFLMTIHDQFEERLIQFGSSHSNENHNDLGQSVTQQCKSYEFTIPNGKILKIIDTPGFGDTRGQDQDEKNLSEIFSYIQSLTHLNALCILLKPNVKELNPSFQSSFRQILHLFGNQFYKNIFFCFTNSQSTFFTVGDTGPELNQFLRKCQGEQMNLKKENTFCFNNRSFRYLVASQCSIKFNERFIDKIEQTWLKSVKESNRLVNQICLQETQKNIDHKWISIEQITREIKLLIRPTLEGIRNICRNIILSENNACERSIQLISSLLDSSRLICYKFDRLHKTFGEFHIISDYFHQSSDQCDSEHSNTNYKLDYQYVKKKTDYLSEDANYYLYGIIKACANFDYFLNNNSQENKDGPFLSEIVRMTYEEKSICEREEQHHLNRKLGSRLKKLKKQYNKDLEEINPIDEHSYLKSIYSRIKSIEQMPLIYEQLNPI